MKIFISYQNQSWPMAKELGEELSAAGHVVHWDFSLQKQGGVPFNEKISSWIADSEIFIFLITAQALNSAWCNAELGFACALQKIIIPIKFEGIQNYQVNDLPFLGKRQIISWSNHENIVEKIKSAFEQSSPEQMVSIRPNRISDKEFEFSIINISPVDLFDVRVQAKIGYINNDGQAKTTYETWNLTILKLEIGNNLGIIPVINMLNLFADKKGPKILLDGVNHIQFLLKYSFQNQERDFAIFKSFPLTKLN